jgi:hypothetical protein
MTDKSAALELQFPRERLNDSAGDPFWIDLTVDEARQLHAQLARHFEPAPDGSQAPLAFAIR